jgi:phospholipid transport system substrate-binding protein
MNSWNTWNPRPRRRAVLAGALLLVAATAARAAATQEAIIKQTIDAAFAVLKDKSLAGREKRPQRIAALRAVADRAFNWAEMARSSLGAQWRSLDSQQRARFVEVFKEVLAARYMDDIDRFQGTETVTVDGSAQQDEEVVVRTTLVTGSRERVPIDYRMRAQQGAWTVVDINIEGVSLVNHFRKTFSNALGNMTVQQLIDHLKQQLPPAVKEGGDKKR